MSLQMSQDKLLAINKAYSRNSEGIAGGQASTRRSTSMLASENTNDPAMGKRMFSS